MPNAPSDWPPGRRSWLMLVELRPANGAISVAPPLLLAYVRAVSAPAAMVAGVLLVASFGVVPDRAAGQVTLIGLPTSETALLGRFAKGPIDLPVEVGPADFGALFSSANPAAWPAEVQARQFFANGGAALYVVRVTGAGLLADALAGNPTNLSGLYALEPLSDLRLLLAPELSLLPADSLTNTLATFRAFLEPRGIFFLLDPPPGLGSASDAVNWVTASVPPDAAFCATYFPYLEVLLDGVPLTIAASGAMAAIYGTNDAANAIWHSPAGTDLPIQAQALSPALSSSDLTLLNAYNLNAIRQFPGTGIVPWGARALDRYNSDNLYVSVNRTRSWMAASIQRALAFAAVADDASPLWGQMRSVVGNFLNSLYQQGAFFGSTPSAAYFVRCDTTTTTAADIAAHRVNLVYGFALLSAGEFDVTSVSVPTYDGTQPVPGPGIHLGVLPGNLVLAYPTVAGYNYVLQAKPDLRSGVWTNSGAAASGDGAWRRPLAPTSAERGFYRLQISPGR
jgi:hypothetical protein